MANPKSFKVGQAPWDSSSSEGNVAPKSFKAGKAPWESGGSDNASPVVSAVRKFAEGGSAGFLDEISGGLESVGRVAGVEGLGGGFSDISISSDGPTIDWEILKEAYETAKNKKREVLKKDQIDNPGVSTTANIAGAIVSPVNKLAKGVSIAKGAAAVGGVTGLGTSEADNIVDVSKDALIGAGAGLVIGKGIEKASPLISRGANKAGEKLKTIADSVSARALGVERGTIKKLGVDNVKEAGRQALDEGTFGALTSVDEMVSRNNALKSKAMEVRRSAYEAIDEAGASTFNPLNVASKVEETILAGKNRAHQDTQELIQKLEPQIQNILSRGDGNIPMSEAQSLVESLGKKAKFDSSRSNEANQMMKQIYHTVRDAVNQSADEAAGKIGIDKVVRKANKEFSLAKKAEELLRNRQAKEQGNNFIGLTDALTGGAGVSYGATTGDWETAALGAGGIKLARKYGAQNVSRVLDNVSRGLVNSSPSTQLAKNTPAAVQSIVQRMEGARPFPKAADNEKPSTRPLKGQEKWANDGLQKLKKSGNDFSRIESDLLKSPKGKRLLIAASDLKPGSKAFQKIASQIEKEFGRSN